MVDTHDSHPDSAVADEGGDVHRRGVRGEPGGVPVQVVPGEVDRVVADPSEVIGVQVQPVR